MADEASQRRVCRMVGLFAEGAYTAIMSSSGTAAVHTAGERRRCFQIPDSLSRSGVKFVKITKYSHAPSLRHHPTDRHASPLGQNSRI